MLVGYPEKIDISPKWPTTPEYYNSAIMVNRAGATVANYRKTFLYNVDETWALEGSAGFHNDMITDLGNTCIGICMDINPYRYEAPWDAFEFASHVLHAKANLVIVCMSWLTREDSRVFSRTAHDPDMDTLAYWVERLEPLIRSESREETIVVFCNRCGQEDDALYAGTSAIVGIQNGEVNVYALAGRGTKELIVADTSFEPLAKLVYRRNSKTSTQGLNGNSELGLSHLNANLPKTDLYPAQPEETWATLGELGVGPKRNLDWEFGEKAHLPSNRQEDKAKKQVPTAPKPNLSKPEPAKQRPAPRILIPQSPHFPTLQGCGGTASIESPDVPTPTGPSPISSSLRPKLLIPTTQSRYEHRSSPYPYDQVTAERMRFFGNAPPSIFTPATPFEEQHEPEPTSAKYSSFSPVSEMAKTPLNYRWTSSPVSPTITSPDFPFPATRFWAQSGAQSRLDANVEMSVSEDDCRPAKPFNYQPSHDNRDGATIASEKASWRISSNAGLPDCLPAPRPGNASGAREEGRSHRGQQLESSSDTKNPNGLAATATIITNGDTLRSEIQPIPVTESPNLSKSHLDEPGWVPPPLYKTNLDVTQNLTPGFPQSPPLSLGRVGRPSDAQGQRARPSPNMAGADNRSIGENIKRASSRKSPWKQPRHRSPGNEQPVSRGRQTEPNESSSSTAERVWNQREPQATDEKAAHVWGRDPSGSQPPAKPTLATTIRYGVLRLATPQDEIVAVEEYIDPACQLHKRRAASAAPDFQMPTVRGGKAIVGLNTTRQPLPQSPTLLPSAVPMSACAMHASNEPETPRFGHTPLAMTLPPFEDELRSEAPTTQVHCDSYKAIPSGLDAAIPIIDDAGFRPKTAML